MIAYHLVSLECQQEVDSQSCEARLLAGFGFTADVQIFGVDEDDEVSATCPRSQAKILALF